MNLVDDLYAGKAIPKGTKPEKVNKEMEKKHACKTI